MNTHIPSKAILLAAGFGSRITPLSYDLPKPMMPLWGVPVLEHVVNALQEFGVGDILVNLHHNPQPIMQWIQQRKSPYPRIQCSFEPDIAGTGGALRRAEWFIGSEPFWMVNTDIAFDVSPEPFLEDFKRHQPLACLWLDDTRGPRTVECMSDGQIVDFASATPKAGGTFTFCGLQLLSPEILAFLPEKPFCTVVEAYRAALQHGIAVRGCCPRDTFWADLGTPDRYLSAHAAILAAHRSGAAGGRLLNETECNRMTSALPEHVMCDGFVAVGHAVSLPEGGRLKNCIIWDGAQIQDGCSVSDSIIGRHTAVRGNHEGCSSILAIRWPSDPVLDAVLKQMRAMRSDTTVTVLPARGSDREFSRIQTADVSRILVRYDDAKRPENGRYARLAEALSTFGIRVPRVIHDMPEQRATLFEDVGTTSLQDILPSCTRRSRLAHYRRVIRLTSRLHAIHVADLPPLEPGFSRALYGWEHDLFIKYFIEGHQQRSLSPALGRILEKCSSMLLQQEQVPIHRDLQSSNILLRGKTPVLIDFQGMRLGSAAYDLASLLCDPYVMLPQADREALLDSYCHLSPQGDQVKAVFPYAAVQRLAQALGAFGRLAAIPATARFSRYIKPAVSIFNAMLEQIASDVRDVLC